MIPLWDSKTFGQNSGLKYDSARSRKLLASLNSFCFSFIVGQSRSLEEQEQEGWQELGVGPKIKHKEKVLCVKYVKVDTSLTVSML